MKKIFFCKLELFFHIIIIKKKVYANKFNMNEKRNFIVIMISYRTKHCRKRDFHELVEKRREKNRHANLS